MVALLHHFERRGLGLRHEAPAGRLRGDQGEEAGSSSLACHPADVGRPRGSPPPAGRLALCARLPSSPGRYVAPAAAASPKAVLGVPPRGTSSLPRRRRRGRPIGLRRGRLAGGGHPCRHGSAGTLVARACSPTLGQRERPGGSARGAAVPTLVRPLRLWPPCRRWALRSPRAPAGAWLRCCTCTLTSGCLHAGINCRIATPMYSAARQGSSWPGGDALAQSVNRA